MTKTRRTGLCVGVGVGVVGGFGAKGFFEVYLIHSEFTASMVGPYLLQIID